MLTGDLLSQPARRAGDLENRLPDTIETGDANLTHDLPSDAVDGQKYA
jgi:hypothetical protein